MGRSRKELYYGSRTSRGGKLVRLAVTDRTSKAARPWNHPDVVNASLAYGVPLNSYKDVHQYENALEDKGSLESHERYTCRDCSQLHSEHEDHQPEQQELPFDNPNM